MGKPTMHLSGPRRRGDTTKPVTSSPTETTHGTAAPAKPNSTAPPPAEERRAWIARAAYFRAERRGFAPGHELEDWLAAEQEADGALSPGASSAIVRR